MNLDVLGRGPTPGMCSLVGNSVLYTRGRVHFEGYLRTGLVQLWVFLDLCSGCPSYMTFVRYMGLTAIRYSSLLQSFII